MHQTEPKAQSADTAQAASLQQQQGPQLLDLGLLKFVSGGAGEIPAPPNTDSPKGGW